MEVKIPKRKRTMSNSIKDPYKYAAIYARESNASAPNPIETQKYICKQYALEHNLLIFKEYSEFISASQVPYQKRRKFMELLEDASKGYFKKIIVTRRDRLTRNFDEFIYLKKIFKKLDVEVLYSNDIEIKESKDYASNFIENIIMALAEMEPRKIKARADAGKNAKKKKGEYGYQPPYGLNYDKKEKHYSHDGIKAEIVKDIFDIFLKSEDLNDHKGIKEKLIEKGRLEGNKEYLDLVNDLSNTKIQKILSTTIYAGLQTAHTSYKYDKFTIYHNGEPHKVSEEYLIPFTNITTIISKDVWYKVVDKWFSYNTISRAVSNSGRRERIIFKDSIKCKKCNKTLQYKKSKFECPTEGCIEINRNVLLKHIIKEIKNWLIFKGDKRDDVIKKITTSLRKEVNKKETKLFCIINRRSKLIEEYLQNPTKKDLRSKIIKSQKKEQITRDDIEELKKKIHFLNNKFQEVIIPLAQAGYVHMILGELARNQSALLELYIAEDIKELDINGRKITIQRKL